MKIVRIDVYRVDYELIRDVYSWSHGQSVSVMNSTIVKLTTDEGLVGYGENCPLGSAYMASYPAGIPAGIGELAPAILGADPLQTAEINRIMDNAMMGHNYVKSPVDIACWDILGRSAGLPACILLGGRCADDYPLYRPVSMDTPEKMAEAVRGFLDEGYHRFQLKVGADPDEDIARIVAVRAILSDGDILVADANTGWNTAAATRVVNGVADVDVYIEQPCPTLRECLSIRKRTSLPMIIDELIIDAPSMLEAYYAGAMDGINIKLSRVGGLTKARQIRDLAQVLGLSVTMEDGHAGDVSTTAVSHLVGSTQPQFYFTSSDQNCHNKLRISPDAPRREDGRLSVPTGPGLGITVDEAALGEPVLTLES